MNYTARDLLVRPSQGEGEKTATDMLIIARARQLGGDFSIMYGYVEPKHIIAPHTHENEDQAVYIIEGELEFEVGGADGLHFKAGPDSYILKPRGVEHCFWNSSDTVTVRYIELSGRDGFEKFVDARKEGILPQQIKARFKLGMSTNLVRTAQLMAQHKLTGRGGAAATGIPCRRRR